MNSTNNEGPGTIPTVLVLKIGGVESVNNEGSSVQFLRYWDQKLSAKVNVREGCQNRAGCCPCDKMDVVLTYVFCCVEFRGGVLDSDTAEGSPGNSTDEESVGFQEESSALEVIELHKLEDMGICDDDDM
jgi:hypothetical protein